MRNNKLKKTVVNLICMGIWILPIYFFVRDFFDLDSINMGESIIKILILSIKQGLYTAIFSFLIALVPAYYSSYKKNFLTKLLDGLIFVPFFFPVISVVTVFSIIFNLDILKNLNILYTFKAIIIANVFYNSPIFVKYINEGLKQIPKDIIEAMRIDGAGSLRIFIQGQLPLILPQIFRAFILVFTYGFLGFGIVLALGGIRFSTLEIEIATSFMAGGNFSRAMYLGFLQVLILIGVNVIKIFIPEYEVIESPKNKNLPVIFKVYSIFYIIIEYGVVMFSFIYSFVNIFTGEISLIAYRKLFSKDIMEEYQIVESIINSFEISIIVSILIIIITYIIIKNYTAITDILIFANLGISGAFLAITLYYMNILFDIPLFILLVLGYLIASIPIAYSFMYQYVKRFPVEILESSRLDCKNRFQQFIYIELPILKNIFLSTFLQIFAVIFGEFTIAYTMQLEDLFPLVSLVNYSLVSDKLYMESSALTSIVVGIILISFILGEMIKRKGD